MKRWKTVMYFSKSKYTSFRQCPKIVWLDKYKPEEKEIDESAQERMASGNIVGDLARTLFGAFTEVTTFDDDGKLDLDAMKRKTAECIDKGIENICETSFDYNGLTVQISKTFFAWIVGTQGKVKIKSPRKVIDEFNEFVAKIKEEY